MDKLVVEKRKSAEIIFINIVSTEERFQASPYTISLVDYIHSMTNNFSLFLVVPVYVF